MFIFRNVAESFPTYRDNLCIWRTKNTRSFARFLYLLANVYMTQNVHNEVGADIVGKLAPVHMHACIIALHTHTHIHTKQSYVHSGTCNSWMIKVCYRVFHAPMVGHSRRSYQIRGLGSKHRPTFVPKCRMWVAWMLTAQSALQISE